MKGKLFVGVLALGLWGGAALAQDTPKMRDIMVTAGGGFEGYTGQLRNAIAPGVAWGVQAAFKPTTVLGLELGYSGAVNELRNHGAFDVTGADIVRNGGHVLATLGLAATTQVQPYLLGGVGLNWYDVRSMGTRETSGNVPVGAGIRTRIGQFTADARLHYNFLLSNDLMSTVGPASIPGYGSGASGKYAGTLSIGGVF